ncbi:restriction endonuclease subunit S [Gallibacterium anatis]|uniref:restriction endonuclease subunit S n=1 Tax=Gallibacterium anatis TaxID=750 RepID=UPI0038B40AB3
MKHNAFLEKLLQGASVEWKTLGEVAIIRHGRDWKSLGAGNIPVYGSGGIMGYVNKYTYQKESVLIPRKGTITNLFYVNKPFWNVDTIYYTEIDASQIFPKFLFYFLKTIDFMKLDTGSGRPSLTQAILNKIQIPIPPLSVQQEIVKILDTLTALTSELTSELTLRQKQYQHYRDKLLTFGDEVEWKTLGEIAEYAKTKIQATELHENNYVGVDNLLQNKMGKTTSNYVPDSGRFTQFIDNDILIGNIRPYLKKIWYSDCIGGTNGDVLVIRRKDNRINPRYLYQVLSDDKFFAYNMKHAKGAKMPRGNKEAILQYLIPIPSLEEQKRIAAILDKFHTLTSSLSDGLPKEIELRQKQYEYYRDLLLNFKQD